MKVAYVSAYNSSDVSNWSGTGYYMYKCIADQGVEVILINSEIRPTWWLKLKASLVKLLFGKRYIIQRDPGYLTGLAAKAEKQLKNVDFDVVLSPGSLAVSYLKITQPVVFWTDATFDNMLDFYPNWKNVSNESIRQGHQAEQKAIDNASLILYISQWALTNALTRYKANPAKVKQIPIGPNLESDVTADEVEELICRRQQNPQINLLFVGVDWVRKGGDMAIETTTKLREMGLNAILTVVGCDLVPKNVPSYVKFHPFVDKTQPAGVKELNEFYRQATFFLLPTSAECFGVVFAEAGAHAVPVVTTNVGGCSAAVKDGFNGFCLDPENFPVKAVEKITWLLKNPQQYRRFSLNAYKNYLDDINWEVVGKKVVHAIRGLVKNKTIHAMLHLYGIISTIDQFYALSYLYRLPE